MKRERTASHIATYAHQIGLAGLGLLERIQKQSKARFGELVEEGKRIEARSKAAGAKRHAHVGHFAETVAATKEVYQKKVEAQLEEWDAQLAQLTAKARQAKADARRNVQGEINSLQAQRAALQNKLAALRNRGEAAWEDLKDGVEKAGEDIRDALRKGSAHFQ